jgi:hypothetical protein
MLKKMIKVGEKIGNVKLYENNPGQVVQLEELL